MTIGNMNKKDSILLAEAYEKVFNKDYEAKLDQKEAYKSSLLRQGEDQSSSRQPESRRAIYNASEDELIQKLEAKGESSTADETKQMFNNIAQNCHTLLTGGGAGEYSGIKINDRERQVLTQISKLILTI